MFDICTKKLFQEREMWGNLIAWIFCSKEKTYNKNAVNNISRIYSDDCQYI